MATSNFFFLKIWQLLCIFSKRILCSILCTDFPFSEQTTEVQHLVDDQIPTQKCQFFLSVKRRNGYVACLEEDKRAAASSSSSFEETWVVETEHGLLSVLNLHFVKHRERENHTHPALRDEVVAAAHILYLLISSRFFLWEAKSCGEEEWVGMRLKSGVRFSTPL
jgi:hypothetical protein